MRQRGVSYEEVAPVLRDRSPEPPETAAGAWIIDPIEVQSCASVPSYQVARGKADETPNGAESIPAAAVVTNEGFASAEPRTGQR
jgi:hypothetical protein